MERTNNQEIFFEIKEHIGTLKNYGNGWTKEINLVAWNGAEAKYDIRDWNPSHDHMSRGITLYPYEMKALMTAMKDRL